VAAELPPIAQECVEGYVYTGRPARLLILRRPPSRESIWVPVSGKVETSDPNFDAALRRELEEETGLTRFRRLFPLNWEVRFEGVDGRPWRLHAYGVELETAVSPRLSDEHVEFEWVSPAVALERLHYADNREAVQRLLERIGQAPKPASAGDAPAP
jgi:8-oxo-dGTP pyrophosphatase MutT (NUDIX family)